ncbi:UNVERIFIED_CONTAM: hypothetical protein NCL1_24309 [Trichonephila clavipes]
MLLVSSKKLKNKSATDWCWNEILFMKAMFNYKINHYIALIMYNFIEAYLFQTIVNENLRIEFHAFLKLPTLTMKEQQKFPCFAYIFYFKDGLASI